MPSRHEEQLPIVEDDILSPGPAAPPGAARAASRERIALLLCILIGVACAFVVGYLVPGLTE